MGTESINKPEENLLSSLRGSHWASFSGAAASEECIKLALPFLTRFALFSRPSKSLSHIREKQKVFVLVHSRPEVNYIISLFRADYDEIFRDCTKSAALRLKQRPFNQKDNSLDENDVGFEHMSVTQQVKTVVNSLLITTESLEQLSNQNGDELRIPAILTNHVFSDKVCDIISAALLELPHFISITKTAVTLLHIKWSTELLVKLVVNQPWNLQQVCESVVSECSSSSEFSNRSMELLKSLCILEPSFLPQLIHIVISENKLTEILAWIYLGRTEHPQLNSISQFITVHRLLAKQLLTTKNQYDENMYITNIRGTLLRTIDNVLEDGVNDSNYIEISVMIGIYATLREIAAYKFTSMELDKLFTLFSKLPADSTKQSRLVIQSLCLMFASMHQMLEHSSRLSSWIRSLSQNTKLYSGSDDGSIGQFLLLIAIHYHSNQLGAISEMVAAHIHVKPTSVKLSNTILKSIITMEVFTEQVISQLTVLLSVTKTLSANTQGHLPIHCVCQLLKSRAFSKNNVSITHWIFNQIKELSLPIHPLVVPMIRSFVSSTIPQQHNLRQVNTIIDEQLLIDLFKSAELDDMNQDDSQFPVQVSLLFYILTHIHELQTEQVASNKKRVVLSYTQSLLTILPMKHLVLTAYKYRNQCDTLYPALLRLLHILYPHLCLPDKWLPPKKVHSKPNRLVTLLASKVSKERDMLQYLYISLRRSDLKSNSTTLSLIQEGIAYMKLTRVDQIPKHFSQVLLEVWTRFARLAPERVYTPTVNTLRDKHKQVTDEQLVSDPLLILQSLPYCKHPVLVTIMLELIEVYTHASRSFYNNLATTRSLPGSNQPLPDAIETCYSLVSAQESAILQILLEQCIQQAETEVSELCVRREIQNLICSYVHKVIIDNPTTVKLVSFQGFDRKLIPIMVSGVPSMHICLDFIPELLAQADIRKQMFSVRLTAALCKQYKVHKAYTMAKLCINTLTTLTTVLPLTRVIESILPLIPHVLVMCEQLPVLYEDWSQLLIKLIPLPQSLADMRDNPKLQLLL